MDNEVAFLREQIDRQVRPGQVGVATVGQRGPGFGAVLGGGFRPGVVRGEGEDKVRGVWGRAKYGVERYA